MLVSLSPTWSASTYNSKRIRLNFCSVSYFYFLRDSFSCSVSSFLNMFVVIVNTRISLPSFVLSVPPASSLDLAIVA